MTTGTGTEGTLLIARKILPTIIEESEKALLPRELAALYLGPGQIPGSSVEVNREIEDVMSVKLVAEGAEIPFDEPRWNNLNVRPRKYGLRVSITREMLEDANFNLLDFSVRRAGTKFAENETSLVVTNAFELAANTVTGGAAATIANITRMMQYLEDADRRATDFVVGFEVLNDLRNIDTFVEFQKVGNTEMIQRGFLGNIYGMNVVPVSTQTDMVTTTAYVFDRRYAYVIAEKRPITVERFDLPSADQEGVAITQRIWVEPLRTNAIARLTTT